MTEEAPTCPDSWCVLPADHQPVHDVLPIPRQVHAGSWWVRAAYLQALGTPTREEART